MGRDVCEYNPMASCYHDCDECGPLPGDGYVALTPARTGPPMKLVVYIAGPISDPDFVAALRNMARFFAAEVLLIRHGFAPINPAADIIAALMAGDFTYEHYLGKDEALVRASGALFQLPGWSESVGATRETGWALRDHVPTFERLTDLLEYRDTVQGVKP